MPSERGEKNGIYDEKVRQRNISPPILRPAPKRWRIIYHVVNSYFPYFLDSASVLFWVLYRTMRGYKDRDTNTINNISENLETTAVRSRILSQLSFASCVRYFDRAYYGFWGEQNLIKTDNIRQNLTAVDFRGGTSTHIHSILSEGVEGGQQRSSPGLVLGFVRLTWCTCGGCSSYIHHDENFCSSIYYSNMMWSWWCRPEFTALILLVVAALIVCRHNF